MTKLLQVASYALVTLATGCAFFSPPAPHKPVEFTKSSPPAGGAAFPNWPIPPDLAMREIERAEHDKAIHIVEVEGAGAGTTGAEESVVAFPDIGKDIHFKLKRVPGDLDGINNSPRKEVAAYAIQSLFLDPEDYVVPTTSLHCLSIERMDQVGIKHGASQVKGAKCSLIAVALWMKDLTLRDPVYDEARFLRDPDYAYFLSNLNVFTYIVGHRDGRKGNFLSAKNDARPQVFAIDNGSTFNPWGYNYFVANWDVMRVAAVRKSTVDRLRKLERSDLDPLLVVVEMKIGSDGMIHKVKPGPSLDDSKGALHRGDTLQFGLTKRELDKVWKRIQKLKEQVDDGSLPVF